MPRPKLKSLKEGKKTDLKKSFSALIFIPRFFKEIWKTNKKLFLVSACCRLIGAVLPVIILWIGKIIIDEIILQTKTEVSDLNILWTYVAIEFGLIILSDLVSRAISLTDGLLGDAYSIDSSVRIIKKTNQINISLLEDAEFYDKLERARTQTTGRVGLMSNALGEVQSLISILTLVAGLIYFEPYLIILLVLSIIPSFINEIWFSQQQYSLARGWTAERRELDYLRFIGANDKTAKEIKLFGLTDFVVDRFKNLAQEYYELNKKLAVKRSALGFTFNVLGTLSYYGAYVFIIYRVISGAITLGELTFLSGSFNRLTKNLQEFFSKFTRITESALYLKDYFDFLDISIEPNHKEDMPLPTTIKEGFEFKNVRFSYPGSDTEILKGISFKMKAGEKLAFVGQNGAGKTTLTKLLLRFYEPTSGEILLDGVNINRFDKAAYQEFFGVIFQDFFKYEFTVKENIAIGDIDEIENQEKIENAAALSLADEVVKELKYGYNQQLGKRFAKGQELSGGQWQKVALARAYMKDAKVMILDEPTSALDAKAESEVFDRFIGLTQSKTSVIISHRFSTVRQADRILVLEEGRVLEFGTHQELMNNKSLYAELFTLQAEGYQ
ncbi:ABC transporter ATP-binding protein [Oceanihabitans sediminis]|uniref:ABC transporter ATP-binding protein n=1 Tax=Oceanihabitans sediminis TaxID=1812012 RepID=A0A368P9N6_9FLAO|nr:ABC transporter ATP-binding protein [Oceanihabitans sediminis]MDX1278607.1 ABC transporter ATP-binding protein [Oceanihabitans sediminis]MDX1773174.1 ABC transporter ATP-binding protein [Oceanihabitans sediminis]RBP34866.1 ATP-binding cassette subfamily B protein [Oceanihabitans sediminis]RCU58509.1 ABC transporter ATP-binding protein [Oceanihabitans sediminis]